MSFDEMLSAPTAAASETKTRRALGRTQAVIGGSPRVSLLPPEIKDAARGRVLRRGMAALVLVSVVVVAAAATLAGAAQASADQELADASARTGTLTSQLAKFSNVQKLQSSVAVGEAAVKVGSSTQIDWKARISEVLASMPYGYSVQSITADSASPVVDYPQGTDPLEKPRAATIQLAVAAPTIEPLSPWLRELRSIPSYADATASSQRADGSGYTVSITLHLNSKAITGRQGDGS